MIKRRRILGSVLWEQVECEPILHRSRNVRLSQYKHFPGDEYDPFVGTASCACGQFRYYFPGDVLAYNDEIPCFKLEQIWTALQRGCFGVICMRIGTNSA
jgi:hypothetical protein